MSEFFRDRLRRFTASVEQSETLTPVQRTKVVREYKKAIETEAPPRLVLIGEAGVGKSTTINALFNAGQEVGHSRATTDRAWAIPVQEVNGSHGTLEVVDMPGLGDDIANYPRYVALYREVVPTADVVVWIHQAENRMVHLVQQALTDLCGSHPELIGRLVFGLNKADEIGPHNWNLRANLPSPAQQAELADRERDFNRKILGVLPTWQGRTVSYSARQFYNLTALFKEMMYALPEHRRWLLEQRMDLGDFTSLVDRKLLQAATASTLAEVGPQEPGPAQQVRERGLRLPDPAPRQPEPQEGPSAPSAQGPVTEALAALSQAELDALLADSARLAEFVRRVEQGDAR
ncbi:MULTISPECIES: GTPase family protein [Streptomyces griseus group]|uniref:GTPase family protein n=1 Tax=Streptomyces griseus group TaxID=629295 RepID=UPI002E0E44C3|nr:MULTISPECIES: GTPase [Streptomyces griseus group]WSI46070.1 50S ribosome-binding GTPase [Streptomyces cyaneofuscatus]WSI52677.1 50S ribosome-binding GTPase [Streptomyces cyaneofuscatus]